MYVLPLHCFFSLAMTVTFLSINAKGLNHPVKRKSLWNKVIQQSGDVLCAQETHFHSQRPPKCTHPKFTHVFAASALTKKRGILTAIRDTVAFTKHSDIADPQGRYHILVCDIESTTYTVVNIYAPNKHQLPFLHQVLKRAKQVQRGYLLLHGHFNLPPDPQVNSTSSSTRHHHSLQPLLHSQELYDAWRCLHSSERDYSFFSACHRVYTQLDLFLTEKWLTPKITASMINDITLSDHALVMLSVADLSGVNTCFVWQSNLRLIQDDQSEENLRKD